MRVKTFVVGYVLALALLLFARQQHADAPSPTGFRQIIDLTHTITNHLPAYEASEDGAFKVRTVATIEKDKYFARDICLPEHYGTHIDAPAHFARGMWTVDQIPAERLVAPLAVIDVSNAVAGNPDYQVSVADIANWEKVNGQLPPGAVVMARTGWDSRWDTPARYRNADAHGVMHFPGYSEDAARFLVETRQVFGLGIDTLSIDYGPSQNFPVHQYTLAQSLYHLENVANLGLLPAKGVTVAVGAAKLDGGSGGPVRILAMLK